jgi:hypothetical protein
MIEVVEGDITKPPLGINIILHQCNTQNTFGAGVALAIKKAFPSAYDADCLAAKNGTNVLGDISKANSRYLNRTIRIYNLYVQSLRRTSLAGSYTSYDAAISCFSKVSESINNLKTEKKIEIGVPYGMGCDRGGGNFTVYNEIIEEFLVKRVSHKVFYVKLT